MIGDTGNCSCGGIDAVPHAIDHAPDCTIWDAGSSPGLYGKYYGLRLTRDDSLVDGFYFVIREDDPAGETALLAYADACESYAPELAADLRKHIRDERLVRGLYDASWDR